MDVERCNALLPSRGWGELSFQIREGCNCTFYTAIGAGKDAVLPLDVLNGTP